MVTKKIHVSMQHAMPFQKTAFIYESCIYVPYREQREAFKVEVNNELGERLVGFGASYAEAEVAMRKKEEKLYGYG